jgi:uncharacterized membrane protein/sporulation protein YlmC with PRC-barrel domain
VVKSYRPPFREVLVPLDQVEETTPSRIKLKCTRDDLNKLKPFEVEEIIRTELPGYLVWSDVSTVPVIPGYTTEPVATNITVKRQNIPQGELAVRRGARVEATDGYVGQVDELLINSNNQQVTHLVLLERHIFKNREITIPVSQIDRVYEDTIYLKLDRQSVEQLPTTPIQRWPINVKDSRLKRRIMMDKMLVVVFDSELKAYDGSRALQELQNEGSINLYAKAVIARDAGGKMEVKQAGDMGPVGTAVGLLTGSLIGLIGGPVGVAIGAYAGTVGGLVYDLANAGVGEDFLNEVGRSLLPGKAAVVAEVWEEWTMPVDTRMEALGGVVFRRTNMEVVDEQTERDVAALKAELAELEAERDRATGEARAKLQAKVDAARGRLQAAQDAIQARIEASQKETEAKIKSLQEQATKESGERKAKREARIAELKAEQKRRSDLLKQAWELTKEALST